MMPGHWPKLVGLQLLCGACALGLAAASAHAAQEDHHHHHPAEQAEHSHAQADQAPGYARQVSTYRLPETTLVRSDGVKVRFPDEIDDGKPVLLNFIYTTCTAVCPILSQSFAELQTGLGAERSKIHMVSVSIDPEEDTPQRLAEYAKHFHAGEQWNFYTGSVDASQRMQRAFQAYFGDKMHHRPMTFMRAAPDRPWVRIEGFATAEELLREYRQLVAAR
jgi:protein SCO1